MATQENLINEFEDIHISLHSTDIALKTTIMRKLVGILPTAPTMTG
jgi:hypothetical protein